MTIDGPTVTIIGAVLSALIVGGIAMMLWGINTLIKINDRLARLEAGQNTLEAGQRSLEVGQNTLEAGQRSLEAGQNTLEASLNTLEVGQKSLEASLNTLEAGQKSLETVLEEIRRRLDYLPV